jgi:hypothetical protein
VIFRRRDDGRALSVLLVQGTYLRLDHGRTHMWVSQPDPRSP